MLELTKPVRVFHGASELKAQFLSNNALDPWVDVNSGPRKGMFANHLAQALVIRGAQERYWQTGAEARYGEATFGVRAPGDIQIIRVIDRIPRHECLARGMKNPQTAVIYRDINTRKVGVFHLTQHRSEHQYFSFEYQKTPYFNMIEEGAEFEKDTPFLLSPSLKEGGGYGYGTNLRFAFLSHAATADDGCLVARSALKKMEFDLLIKRDGSWGQTRFPLNLHGDHNEYKILRDIGEPVREDGLLFATRGYDDRLSITDMGINDTRILDMAYDERVYARAGKGIVTDIRVYHDLRNLPNGTSAQIERYKMYMDSFYQRILKEYDEQKRHYGTTRFETDELDSLVIEALANTDFDIGDPVQKLHHKTPIDDWRVEVDVHYRVTPDVGNKLTGCNGDKSVIVRVLEDEDMPRDENGNMIDICMSIDSPVNRQNFGAMYEPFFNSATEQVLNCWTDKAGLDRSKVSTKYMEEEMARKPDVYAEIWDEYMELISILSPYMHEYHTQAKYDTDKARAERLAGVFDPKNQAIHILSPTDRMPIWREAVKGIMKRFPPHFTPMTYTNCVGERVTTREPVPHGMKYFMLLEKDSSDWLATDTAKFQVMGFLGQITSTDKYSEPAKKQPVKGLAEAEMSLIVSHCGGEVAADLHDRNNNKQTHREYAYSILSEKEPTNIKRGIDRNRLPLGDDRALQMFKHILTCNGYGPRYKPYVDPDLPR